MTQVWNYEITVLTMIFVWHFDHYNEKSLLSGVLSPHIYYKHKHFIVDK